MSEHAVSHEVSTVTLSLEVASSLEQLFRKENLLAETLRQKIGRGIAEVLDTLGIPGEPVVQIAPLAKNTVSTGQFMRVLIHDQLCRYADELLQRVYSYVHGVPLGSETKPVQILAWLRELSNFQTEITEPNQKSLIEFLSLTCLEIIKRQPAVLFGPAQLRAYQSSLPTLVDESDLQPSLWPPDQSWLLSILTHVLNLHISIADKPTVAEVLKEGLSRGRSREDIVEDLIVALRPEVIEIQLPPAYLHQITTRDTGKAYDQFTLMRDGLFYELGLRYPTFTFVAKETIKPHCFAFQINHLTSLPWASLQPDQCLVNDTPSRIEELLGIQSTTAINPTNANVCSLISSSARPEAEAAGLTTWNAMEYLILCFSTTLRENSALLVHRQAVQGQLVQLEQAFPALIKAAQSKVSLDQITRVLRALIAEEISVRNLRVILEWIVDYDYIITDPSQYIIFDDRLPVHQEPDKAWLINAVHLTSFVRSGMKRYISHKYTQGQSTLIVYLLDPDIERILAEYRTLEASEQDSLYLDVETCDKILEAIRAEIATLPPTSITPVLLTTIEVRPALRQIIAPEFPRLPVLAYQELSPDLNIQPLARISLGT